MAYYIMENQLWELEKVCLDAGGRTVLDILDAIRWYIGTGRSSCQFDKAFVNLGKAELKCLVEKCLKAKDFSCDGIMRVVKREIGNHIA